MSEIKTIDYGQYGHYFAHTFASIVVDTEQLDCNVVSLEGLPVVNVVLQRISGNLAQVEFHFNPLFL